MRLVPCVMTLFCLMSMVGCSPNESRLPDVDSAVSCFAILAYGADVEFPGGVNKWERLINEHYSKSEGFVVLERVMTELTEHEDSDVLAKELARPCAKILKKLEAASK